MYAAVRYPDPDTKPRQSMLIQEMALGFLDFFNLDHSEGGMRIRLSAHAPAVLIELTRKSGALDNPELLVCLFEGLSCIAESDSPFACEIDGKVCPPDLFYQLLDDLMHAASTA